MSQIVTVVGHVTYTPGDGVPLVIPQGPVEADLTFDSATLSWEAESKVVGLTAIPRTQFDDYVREGKIRLSA